MIRGLIIGTLLGLLWGFLLFGLHVLPEVVITMGKLEIENYHDPTLLEQAISKELNAQDSYDIILYSKRTGVAEISFEITGKATPYYLFDDVD